MTKQKTLLDTDYLQLCDKHGMPIDGHVTISEANQRGLWHIGVVVLIWDKQANQVLVQKRASNIIYYPSYLEFSVGGGAKLGETPEQAALREVFEEVGVQADAEQLTPLFTSRYNHAFSHQTRHSRVVNYAFLLTLDRTPELQLLDHEVANAQFISWQSALRLTIVHQYKSLGRLLPKYAFYRKLLVTAQKRALQPTAVVSPMQ